MIDIIDPKHKKMHGYPKSSIPAPSSVGEIPKVRIGFLLPFRRMGTCRTAPSLVIGLTWFSSTREMLALFTLVRGILRLIDVPYPPFLPPFPDLCQEGRRKATAVSGYHGWRETPWRFSGWIRIRSRACCSRSRMVGHQRLAGTLLSGEKIF